MEAKRVYTEADCIMTGLGFSIRNQVVVLDQGILPKEDSSQLFYCVGGDGADVSQNGHFVLMADLSTGGYRRWNRQDVIGILKPERMPEEARLQLSQLRPAGALDLQHNEPKYSGYSFLPSGRYAQGVWLCSEKEVMDYIKMQKPYQHRIMICDRDDFCVLEIREQKQLFPSQAEMSAFTMQEEQSNGMEMK